MHRSGALDMNRRTRVRRDGVSLTTGLEAGPRSGHCEILSALGAGGMGAVYAARDEELFRDPELEVLPAERESKEP